jgi:hypothetical protein
MAKIFKRFKERANERMRQWAGCLQKRSEYLSIRGKKIALFFFFLLFAGSNVIVIINAVVKRGKAPAVHIGRMPNIVRTPEHAQMPFISREEYNRIEHFKNYIQGLPKPSFDSFMAVRPKLLDSISIVEQYYLSQNKK